MACQNENSITLFFPNSGIHISTEESDIRAERRSYSVGTFRVPEPAAMLVSEKVPDGSPVEVRVGEHVSRLMMYHGDSLSFERTLHDEDVADIELVDPVRILERGSITKRFSDVTLDTVIQYIFDQIKDPNNVLHGYRYSEGATGDEDRIASGLYGELVQGIQTSGIPYGSEVTSFMDGVGDVLGEKLRDETYSGFIFTNITPLEAFNRVVKEFEVDYWVDRDGIINIGLQGAIGQIVGVINGTDELKLSRYAVTNDPDKVNSVYVESDGDALASNRDRGTSGQYDGLRLMAEATDPTIQGHQQVAETEKSVSGLDKLEDIAVRQLIRVRMEQTNGSIEINATASEGNETLAHLDVGDVLSVGDQVNIACDRDLITGPFLVNGIDHKDNPRQGWTISLDVARIPVLSSIETRTVVYDPKADKKYSDLDQFDEDPENLLGPDFGRYL